MLFICGCDQRLPISTVARNKHNSINHISDTQCSCLFVKYFPITCFAEGHEFRFRQTKRQMRNEKKRIENLPDLIGARVTELYPVWRKKRNRAAVAHRAAWREKAGYRRGCSQDLIVCSLWMGLRWHLFVRVMAKTVFSIVHSNKSIGAGGQLLSGRFCCVSYFFWHG